MKLRDMEILWDNLLLNVYKMISIFTVFYTVFQKSSPP